MKKITLLLLLVISVLGVQAQTYQLNYDSIRVGKTAGTGGTSLYGKVYLKNTTTGLSSDSILVYRGGRIYRIKNTSNINIGSISSTPNSNGISYASDTLKLHAVTATTGGVLTNGTDSIGGDKFFTNDIWVTDSQISDGHIGIVSGSGSLMAPLLGSASETSTYWMQILAHPASNLYNTNPTDGIIFQVYNNEGPDPITAGNAFNFKNGTTSLFNIQAAGDANLWGGLNITDNRVSNGGISLGSGAPGSLNPTLNANSESSTAWFNFGGSPATNINNTNPTDAFKFNAYKSNDGSQALTGGNLVNFFNKDVSKFSVDYNGVVTSAGLTNGLVKSTSGVLSNATAGTDYTLLNGTGIVEMAGTTPSYLSSTGSGNVVKATSPTLTTPNIGNATGGTLSLSGTLTSTQGNNTTVYSSASATTGYQFFNMQNTSGRLLWGIDGSAGGSFITGGSAYSGAMTTVGAKNLEFGTNQVKAITIDGTTQDVTIANNITANNLTSGTYTPTLTNGANAASSSQVGVTGYMRIGNQVMVSGAITITPTLSGGVTTSVQMSLPITSSLGTGYGNVTDRDGHTAIIQVASGNATIDFLSFGTSAVTFQYNYQYTVSN